LISDGFTNITTLPYQILPPIIVLALLMLAFNFVGDGVREALAPRIEDM
jgi:oligopeptide transport system permease protein